MPCNHRRQRTSENTLPSRMTHSGACSACPSPEEVRVVVRRTAPEMDGHRVMCPPSCVHESSVRLRLSKRLGDDGRLPRLREDACRDALRLVLDGSREPACSEELGLLGATECSCAGWHRA